MRISLYQGSFDEVTVADALLVLTDHNVRLLRRSTLPFLYVSGVRYQREPAGVEDWYPADLVLQRGVGDCEDLAAWRAAELIVYGIRALGPSDTGAARHLETQHRRSTDGIVSGVQAILRAVGGSQYHALVAYQIGGRYLTDDPSARLGMRTPSPRLDASTRARTAAPAPVIPTSAALIRSLS